MAVGAEAALVADLRDGELAAVASEATAGRLENILRALDERGTAQELIRQQYTGRYPFELLQNAEDAAAGVEGGGTVRFELTESALVVADCGLGFGVAQIRAICGLGRSSKDPRESIGYKGLGFKAVGEISQTPQIISQTARFGFSEDRARQELERVVGDLPADQRLPVYAFPFDVTADDLGHDGELIQQLASDGFRSVIRLPFKAGVGRETVDNHLLTSLAPHLLLFLNHTSRLELVGTSKDFDATIAREPQGGAVEALLDIDGSLEHWLTFRQDVAVDTALVRSLGEGWGQVERVATAAAVRLGDDGRPSVGPEQRLHVYFPTVERTGLQLLLHGDFALELDRRHVARTPEAAPYNTWMVDQVATLVAEHVVPNLVERFPGDPAVVHALAPVGQASDFGQAIYDAVVDSLRRVRFVPCIDGMSRLAVESRLLPASVPDPHEAHQFLDLSNSGRLVHPDVEAHDRSRRFLADQLQAEELSLDEALAKLRQPGDETDEIALHRFLVRWSESVSIQRFALALVDVACVRTVNGSWASPADGLFFPRKREDLRFPAHLAVPVIRLSPVEGLEPILLAAGIRPFEWRQLLPEFVLPLLVSTQTEDGDRLGALEALRAYYESERGDQRIQAQVARSLLPARSADGSVTALRSASDLYFSAQWLGNDRLETIYGPFGQSDFLALSAPPDADAADADRAFYEWMGVASRPRVYRAEADQKSAFMLNNLARHPHRSAGGLWKRWLESAELQGVAKCDQNHDSQQLRISFLLDRFCELVEDGDRDRLIALWQALSDDLAMYEPAMTAEVRCQHGWHSGSNTQRVRSLFRLMLDDLEWVPCFHGGQPVLASPRAAWRLSPDTPRRIAARVHVLAPSIAEYPGASVLAALLGVVDAARPDADDLIYLLNGLADEADGSEGAGTDVFEAARWAMRTLNDVLDRQAETPLERPRFLARFEGRRVFVHLPAVATDPLLEETWEPMIPVLDADRNLRRLYSVFDLRILDEAVKQVPVARPLADEANLQLQARVRQSMPFLAALAAAEAPSQVDTIFRGLSRLEVIGCEHLQVRYELDEVARTRDEAVSFIAVRVLSEGRRRQIGTAYLEIDPDTGTPHWYVFGPQLARYLNVPTQGDAFALLLATDHAGRERFVLSRRVPLSAVDDARIRLDLPIEEEDLSDLLPDIGSGRPERPRDGRRASDAPADPLAPSSDEVEAPEPSGDSGDPIVLPEVDLDAVAVSDATTAPMSDTAGRGRATGGGLGPTGPVDFDRRSRLQRAIGKRGEQIAVEIERRRVQAHGIDPDVVVWRSQRNTFAPYDIESVSEDGQRVYIEVKSTTSSDPTDPFEISEPELQWAIQKADRFFVYRVTEAHTATPKVTRFADPIGLMRYGHAALRVSGARMAFRLADDSESIGDD